MKLTCIYVADIDPSFTNVRHKYPSDFQAVISGIGRYITSKECIGIETLAESPMFKSISTDGKWQDILEVVMVLAGDWNTLIDLCAQLLSYLLVASMSGPKCQEYIATIQKLDINLQQTLGAIIQLV
jgi:hypothetical protein